MTITTTTLIELSQDFITLFGLKKPARSPHKNSPNIFPYGVEGTELYKEFEMSLDTRENYLEFVDYYKELIFEIEDRIIETRLELAELNKSGDPKFARRYLQSKAKLLGNMAHKLYYLRTNARSWRREVNVLTHEMVMA